MLPSRGAGIRWPTRSARTRSHPQRSTPARWHGRSGRLARHAKGVGPHAASAARSSWVVLPPDGVTAIRESTARACARSRAGRSRSAWRRARATRNGSRARIARPGRRERSSRRDSTPRHSRALIEAAPAQFLRLERRGRSAGSATHHLISDRHARRKRPDAILRNKYYFKYNSSFCGNCPPLVATMAGAVALEVVRTPETATPGVGDAMVLRASRIQDHCDLIPVSADAHAHASHRTHPTGLTSTRSQR